MINDDFKKRFAALSKKNMRINGRKPDEFRQPLKVEYGVTKNAEGSARVQIGETIVLAGVKLSVEKPYPDTPEQGNIIVNVELLAMSDPEYSPGPPTIKAIELSRVIDRGIRESEAINVKDLCIEKGEKVWTIAIDICTLNDAGNLFDACALAALSALKDTKFPMYEDGIIDYKTRSETPLPLTREPIGVTVFKIGDMFVVDPDDREEEAYDARLTVTTTQDGTISAMQKGGDSTLNTEEVLKMVDTALEASKKIREKL